MPETTPLIKAALNLRVGVGFDVYTITFSYHHPNFLLFCAKKHQFPDASKLSHVINHALYYIISRLSNA